jgi:hypothetical protein
MRGHQQDLENDFRPKGDRIERDDRELMGRAAAAGRTDVLGPAGLLGLQRAVGNAGVGALVEEDRSPVHDVVGSGGGAPLDAQTRSDMEARFGGQDFGDVRVHTDAAAQDSARAVNAHAYTVGHNIVFQRDRYDPGSEQGRLTLAHELTHVVQQRSGPVDGTDTGGGLKVSDPSDRFEREAVTNAERVMSGPAPVSVSASPAAVQREAAGPAEGEEDEMQKMSVDLPLQREEGDDEETA